MPRKRKPKVPEGPPLPEVVNSVVLIAWEDAASGAGELEDAATWMLPIQYSLGFIRHADKEKIILAASYCPGRNCPDFGEPTGIPASLPRRVWVPTGWREVEVSETSTLAGE